MPQYEALKGEIELAIRRVLRSGRYILAQEVESFEREFAAYLGVDHAIGVASGTDGLTLALRALHIGEGDEVITTPFTAIATCSAIVDAGARPVFVDISPDTFLLDINKVSAVITDRTRAAVPVHIFGNVVDVPRLRQTLPANVAIVEDSAQSHGSTLRGAQSGTMGDLGVFSFYPTKNLGAYGDGGMVVTNDPDLAQRLRLLRTYGMTDKDHTIIDGINSRLDELQAAILRVKLRHLNDMNARRNSVALRYYQYLNPEVFQFQRIGEGVVSNYHIFSARCRVPRQPLIDHLTEREIQTNVYYRVPLHLQEANAHLRVAQGALPVAEEVCRDVIALPIYPEFPESLQRQVVGAVNEFGALALG